jgi:hypothetical protein
MSSSTRRRRAGALLSIDLSDPLSSDSRHSSAAMSSRSASILNLVRFAPAPSGSVADIGTNKLVLPLCSTSKDGAKLPQLCDARQMTRNDRPSVVIRAGVTPVTALADRKNAPPRPCRGSRSASRPPNCRSGRSPDTAGFVARALPLPAVQFRIVTFV